LTRRGERSFGKVGKTNAKKPYRAAFVEMKKKKTKRAAAFENAFSAFKTLKNDDNLKTSRNST